MASNLFVSVRIFSQFFAPWPESTSNLRHFEKRMSLIAYVFPKIKTGKNMVKPMSKKACFGTPFDSQHIKWSQKMVKFEKFLKKG